MAGVTGSSLEHWSYNEGNSKVKKALEKLKTACTENNYEGEREAIDFFTGDDIYGSFEYDEVEYLKKGAVFVISEFGSCKALEDLLIIEGVELGMVNEEGASALHCTMLDKNLPRGLEKSALLVDYDAGVRALDDKKRNLLHYSAWKSDENSVKFFLEKGLDANGVDEEGKSPLHYAMMNEVESSTIQKVQALLDSGANPNVKDKGGRLPLEIAGDVKRQWHEQLKRLVQACQNPGQ